MNTSLDIASELELPRLGHRLPKHVLTIAEAELVLAQPDVTNALGLRDRALMETLYSTGMRRRDLASLKLLRYRHRTRNRDDPPGQRQKGSCDSDRRARRSVDREIRSRIAPQLVVEPDDGTVFLSNAGEPFSLDHLSDLVPVHVDASKTGKRGACHLFRHTMATLMLEGGADIRYIQAMLGHTDLKTAEIYTQVSIPQLKQIHTATHPARLVPSNQAHTDTSGEAARAELLSTLDAEAEEDNEAANRL
jgi:integrase/recombinase XerD